MLYMYEKDNKYIVVNQKPWREDYICLTWKECGSYLTKVKDLWVGMIEVTINKDFQNLIDRMFEESPLKISTQLNEVEKEIMQIYSDTPRCPINNEDWTDAHQEYLEYQYHKRDLDDHYQQLQAKLYKALRAENRKIQTALEYYRRQKDFEKTVEFYKEHHINGF